MDSNLSFLATYCELCTSGRRAFTFSYDLGGGRRVRVKACTRCTRREQRRRPRLRPRPLNLPTTTRRQRELR